MVPSTGPAALDPVDRAPYARSMVQGGVDRTGRPPGPTHGIARRTSKHQLPRARSTVVIRTTLLDRLLGPRPGSVTSIVAPAGYGKTTLLQQWADRERDVAYVRLDGRDDDPAVLLSDLIVGLQEVGAVDVASLDRLGVRGSDLGLLTFQRLTDELWDLDRPVVLMLDDLHTVTGRASIDGLSWLADRLPDALRLVLAGRTPSSLPMARLAASGRWTSVTASDLAFDADQTIEMAAAMGSALPRDSADGPRGRDAGLAGRRLPVAAASETEGRSGTRGRPGGKPVDRPRVHPSRAARALGCRGPVLAPPVRGAGRPVGAAVRRRAGDHGIPGPAPLPGASQPARRAAGGRRLVPTPSPVACLAAGGARSALPGGGSGRRPEGGSRGATTTGSSSAPSSSRTRAGTSTCWPAWWREPSGASTGLVGP